MLPKKLTNTGFCDDGEPIKISSLGDIRNFIRENFRKKKTINTRISSYGLKHLVSNIIQRDILNGDFIASMVLEGYEFQKDNKYPRNAFFNVMQETVNNIK